MASGNCPERSLGVVGSFMTGVNAYSDSVYFKQLVDIALGRFTWHDLPDSVDQRYLECCLLFNGSAAFFWHKDLDRFLVSQWADDGVRNVYNNPTHFVINGINLPSLSLNPHECVPIWGNRTRTPEVDFLIKMADRLVEVDNAIDCGITLQKHPVLIASRESQRLSMVNALRQIEEGMPAIFGTEDLNTISDTLQAIDLGADKVDMIKLMDLKSRIWQDALMSLGIDTVDQSKRERMIVAEAEGATGQSTANRRTSLMERAEACKRINDMFKLSVSVEYNYG